MVSALNINLFREQGIVEYCDEEIVNVCPKSTLENFFSKFRKNTIGNEQSFESPFGKKEIIYADWTASGRAYQPIEEYIQNNILPFVGNTHTETAVTGTLMGKAYEGAKHIIKNHVGADCDDALVFCGSGMTAAVNKLQRILGLRVPERIADYMIKDAPVLEEDVTTNSIYRRLQLDELLKPIVFVTEMEHHSNHISWLETIADVEIIRCCSDGNVDLQHFQSLLQEFKYRKNKIAAITACSNVTGIQVPYHTIARLIHEHGGLCFVDFACSAPYVNINMHPDEKGTQLDAIYFSPHKFLGGPGTPGVLIFNKKIYTNAIPDQPGGGTLVYSNPWGGREYTSDIEQREDGGTPPFLQGIKAAMCVRLKEEMGVEKMFKREREILKIIFTRFSEIRNIEVLKGDIKNRLGVVSFIVKGAHYNLIVKILNDRFGIQTRGGCSCAGTYGHRLLNVNKMDSCKILNSIRSGDLSAKPGWVRLSVHPTMSNIDIDYIMDAIELTAAHYKEWGKSYMYDALSNEYQVKRGEPKEQNRVEDWFNVEKWQRPKVKATRITRQNYP